MKSSLNTFITTCKKICQKEKEIKIGKNKKETLKAQHKIFLEKEFQTGVKDFKALSELTKFSQQQIRNYWIKWNSNYSIHEDYRNQRKKLNEEHCDFILNYFAKTENIDKTISELHTDLIIHFNLDKSYISY